MTDQASTMTPFLRQLEDLPLVVADDDAPGLVAELRRAGLPLAAASVAAGQRSRRQILADAAADLLGRHR